MAGLSLEAPEEEDAVEVPSAGPSAPPQKEKSPFEKQPSFDLSATNTFSVEGLKLHGARGMAAASGKAEVSTIGLADLERDKLLGRGASGRVFLVRHRQTGEMYAMKELTAMADEDTRHMAVNELRIAHTAGKQGGMQACMQEHLLLLTTTYTYYYYYSTSTTTTTTSTSTILTAPSHCCVLDSQEHLVRFVDAYFFEGQICLLMEFCDGGSLEDMLKAVAEGGAPPMPLGPVTLQICHGLQYMHREMKQARHIPPPS